LISHVLVLVHGLPRMMGMGRQAAGLLPELAEHLANESGWVVATGTLSGVGTSTGTFSATQWRRDLELILDRVVQGERQISLAGFGFGGALALRIAAGDERMHGVATFAAPAHLEPWCGAPEEFHRSVQVAGVVADPNELLGPEELRADVVAIDPLGAVAQIPPRRLLIGHGTDDLEIPVSDARDLLNGADGRAELRLDPRGRSPIARRPAHGGDPARLARPAPLDASATSRARAGFVAAASGSGASQIARTTTKWRSPALDEFETIFSARDAAGHEDRSVASLLAGHGVVDPRCPAGRAWWGWARLVRH
jgi:alpha/beta superfamily hydrolase